jgi:hypothetical protein
MRPQVADDQSAKPRRDAEPHRGSLLLQLAEISLACAPMSVL